MSSKRSRRGCLCCRKRKIKCDEGQPVCHNCTKSSYECVWPKDNEALPHNSDFKLVKSKKRNIKFVEANQIRIHPPKRKLVLACKSPKEVEKAEDKLFRSYLCELSQESGLPLLPTVTDYYMTEFDTQCYDAFLRGFMVLISPQITHKYLQPACVFVPPGTYNPILRSVFYACGASFLSDRGTDMKDMVDWTYEHSLETVCQFVETESISGNESWLIIALLCYCLREKCYGTDININTAHLGLALAILRVWMKEKYTPTRKLSDDNKMLRNLWGKLVESSSDGNILRLFYALLNNLKPDLFVEHDPSSINYSPECPVDEDTEVKEDELSVSDSKDIEVTVSFPLANSSSIEYYERTLLESFFYNYSVNLYICDQDSVNCVISPYEIYDTFKGILYQPLYDCPVPWMNNPVMGAAISAFEMAAKANWLRLKYPFDEPTRAQAMILLASAKYYTRPILPLKVKMREPENVQRRLLESCYLGEMVSKATIILLKKLLFPDIKGDDPEITQAVDQFTDALYQLTLHSPICSICPWPLAVAGAAAVTKKNREYILWRIKSFLEVARLKSLACLQTYLRLVWDGPGIDALVDRSYLGFLSM